LTYLLPYLPIYLLTYLLSYLVTYWLTDILTYLLTYCLIYLLTNLRIDLLTYLLTPYSTVLLEKLTSSQLVKKFPPFYGTRRFITTFTTARHLSLSWASSTQSITPDPTSWRSILILPSYLCLGLPDGLYPSGFPTKTPYTTLLSPYVLHVPPISSMSIWSPEWYLVSSSSPHSAPTHHKNRRTTTVQFMMLVLINLKGNIQWYLNMGFVIWFKRGLEL